MPERKFFFGVLSSLRQQYMRDIIAEAHKNRYKPDEEEKESKTIAISEAWLQEL